MPHTQNNDCRIPQSVSNDAVTSYKLSDIREFFDALSQRRLLP
jgi:hypothetical protein